MDSSSRQAQADDHPRPTILDFFSIGIALLTLTLPMGSVFRYAAQQPLQDPGPASLQPRLVQLRPQSR